MTANPKLNRRRRKRGLPTRRTTLSLTGENMAFIESEAAKAGESLSLVLDRLIEEKRMASPTWSLEQIAATLPASAPVSTLAAEADDDQIEL